MTETTDVGVFASVNQLELRSMLSAIARSYGIEHSQADVDDWQQQCYQRMLDRSYLTRWEGRCSYASWVWRLARGIVLDNLSISRVRQESANGDTTRGWACRQCVWDIEAYNSERDMTAAALAEWESRYSEQLQSTTTSLSSTRRVNRPYCPWSVYTALAAGHSVTEIADLLHCSRPTVRTMIGELATTLRQAGFTPP